LLHKHVPQSPVPRGQTRRTADPCFIRCCISSRLLLHERSPQSPSPRGDTCRAAVPCTSSCCMMSHTLRQALHGVPCTSSYITLVARAQRVTRASIACCDRRGIAGVQGNCSGPPPPSETFSPLAPLRPGQCVLTVSKRAFEWYKKEAAQNVWLHGLYVYGPSAVDVDLVFWNPTTLQSRLYATKVTFHGGTCFGAFKPSYLAGAQLALQHCLRLLGPATTTPQSVWDAREITCGHCAPLWAVLLLNLAQAAKQSHSQRMSTELPRACCRRAALTVTCLQTVRRGTLPKITPASAPKARKSRCSGAC
jgi:hypothetical protein